MTITAKNIGRINVWPTYAVARDADTGESKFTGQLTVWQTNEEALANTTHEEEGGGGGAPAWVPANAVIHIDLVGGTPQGRAWVQGTGAVTLGSVLNLRSCELVSQGVEIFTTTDEMFLTPTLTGAAMTWLSARVRQFAFTVEWEDASTVDPHPESGVAVVYAAETAATGNSGVDVGSRSAPLYVGVFASDLNGNYDILGTLVVDGINKIAFTYIDNDTYGSAFMGGAAVEGPTDGLVNSAYTEFNLGAPGSHAGYIRSLTLYDPLPSTAGLSELSEV